MCQYARASDNSDQKQNLDECQAAGGRSDHLQEPEPCEIRQDGMGVRVFVEADMLGAHLRRILKPSTFSWLAKQCIA